MEEKGEELRAGTCSWWEASEQLHPSQPCLLTLLSQTLALSLGVLCSQHRWLLCNSTGVVGRGVQG